MPKPEWKPPKTPRAYLECSDTIDIDYEHNIQDKLLELLQSKKYKRISQVGSTLYLDYEVANPDYEKEVANLKKYGEKYNEDMKAWQNSEPFKLERLAKLYDKEKDVIDAMLKKNYL